MLRFIDHKKMGRGKHENFLDSHFHFSFADYYNPKNMNFGILRVINDDIVNSGTGFDMHFHRDMEIITYVIDGYLTHEDSMGHKETLSRGEVQYISAGTGISHSEYNYGKNDLRLLQIWVLPDGKGYEPSYGSHSFKWEERKGKWLPITAHFDNKDSEAPIRLHADMNIYATEIQKGEAIEFRVEKGRQAYMVLIDGKAIVSEMLLSTRDALEITEENILIKAEENTHILILEMEKN